jgi:hypothetical protein
MCSKPFAAFKCAVKTAVYLRRATPCEAVLNAFLIGCLFSISALGNRGLSALRNAICYMHICMQICMRF